MLWEQQIQYATISDIGFRRRNNQDACVVQLCSDQETWRDRGHLLMVADGMGGHAVGELASKIAADTVPHTFFKTKNLDVPVALKAAIEAANAAIYERGIQNPDFERMGTTCVALVLSPRGAVIGHVGDSRLYCIRNERINQLTFDHSLQWELLRRGKRKAQEIQLQESRHVITRSLGPEQSVEVDIEGPNVALPGDVYLLCSDGLTGHVTDSEIGAIAGTLPENEACHLLVNLANLRGGSDNITVVIARIGEIPAELADDKTTDTTGGPSWWSLIGYWSIAAMLVAGVVLSLFDQALAGVRLLAVALIAALVLIIRWALHRSQRYGKADGDKTVLWRPYRSASAKFSPKFLKHLLEVELELQRAATEEGWPIDWSEHEVAYNKAKTAAAQRHYPEALRGFAKAIDILMTGIQQQRKQKEREAKRGKSSKTTT